MHLKEEIARSGFVNCPIEVSLTTQLDTLDEPHTVVTVEFASTAPPGAATALVSLATLAFNGNTYLITTLAEWRAFVKARADRGPHVGVVLSGVPFRITDEAVAVWAKLLGRKFGTCSSHSVNVRKHGSGYDGSVTMGFDLGTKPMPTERPKKVPLVYGGAYLGALEPCLGQVRVLGQAR